MNLSSLNTLEYNKVKAMLKDMAGSSMGKELAEELLPINDISEIDERLAETGEGAAVLSDGESAPVGGIRDIRPLLKKARLGALLEAFELLDVYNSLYAMRQVKKFFKQTEIAVPLLKAQAQQIEILGQLEQMLENAVDEHGALKDSASSELLRLRRSIRQGQRQIKERLDAILRMAEYQKFFQEAIVTMRGDRYVIPIKCEYKTYFPGLVHDQSATGSTLFIEPMAVVNLNNEIKQFEAAEKHEILEILKKLTKEIVKQADFLNNNCDILAHIDFVFAKAKLARHMQAVRPEMNKDGITELKRARHPLIAAEKIVPIDIHLGRDFSVLLITGPNTGGKTVSIKTLGLLALMAQSGLFVPAASGSKLAVYRRVYADIGDEQSIEQSLSTFSAHMTHLVQILDDIDEDDLLLVDEIGAGTDPEEGAALAMAILEHLMKIGTKTIATTHYSELKTFAYSREGIENASVEFDIKTLSPTYRLLIGIPGTSNAFAISNRLGLSESLIIRARQLIDADHAQFENILNTLEHEKMLYEQKNADIREREQHIRRMESKMVKLKAEFSEKKERLITKAKEDSAALVRRTRRESEQIIKSLKEQFNDQGIQKRQAAIEEARRRVKEGIAATAVSKKADYSGYKKIDGALKAGDDVFVVTLGQKGTVLSCSGKTVQVQLGVLKMNVAVKDCLISRQKAAQPTEPKKRKQQLGFIKVQSVERQIDLRGMMVDEAEEALGKYIDDAVLAGLKQVIVIHGKGTGALRKGVRAYLDKHKNVLSCAMAGMNEGGDGATVVELQ
jgi:DNA mismatch repair protein MutS2